VKILMLADGGCEHTLRFQAEAARQGAEVVLASLEPGETVDIRLPKKFGIAALDYFFLSGKLDKIVRRVEPDLVNPQFVCSYGSTVALSGVWSRYPVLMHALGSDILVSPRKSWLHRRRVVHALSRCPDLLVDSEYLAAEIKKYNSDVRCHIIAWGADEAAFEMYDNKKSFDMERNRPLRILVPRPHNPVYNNDMIFTALAGLINDRRVTVTFPARGDRYEAFRKIAEAACPAGGIDYYDYMPREKYVEFMAGFDIYLSASRSDSSPASLIEAMAIGLVPVVADIEGVREWMDKDSGAVFQPDSNSALKDAIVRLLADDIDVLSIRKNNHDKARRRGRFVENVKETLDLMEKAVADARR